MKTVLNDLIAEQALVDTLVADLTEEQWNTKIPTDPAWTIKDTIIHLAFFDYTAIEMLLGHGEHIYTVIDANGGLDENNRSVKYENMIGADVLTWWREMRVQMTALFMQKNEKDRVNWAPGIPPMRVKSLASARLMELWAHSVDIYNALGKEIIVKERITSTLFLSWQARPNAYRINGLKMTDTPVYLELTLPSGELWTAGEPNTENYIKGSAKDWAVVSVRRIHPLDTDLEIVGEEAMRFASVVQTYAGDADAAPPAKKK